VTPMGKAKTFEALHVRGNPVILYNAWDAGSAKAIADAGAKAIATSSYSVAQAQGYSDGEANRGVFHGHIQADILFHGRSPSDVWARLRRREPVLPSHRGTATSFHTMTVEATAPRLPHVNASSDAGARGLHTCGDLIRRAGDRNLSSVADLSNAVATAKKAGRKDVLVLIARNGRQLFVPLHVDSAQG